jgi:hypothetical protein
LTLKRPSPSATSQRMVSRSSLPISWTSKPTAWPPPRPRTLRMNRRSPTAGSRSWVLSRFCHVKVVPSNYSILLTARWIPPCQPMNDPKRVRQSLWINPSSGRYDMPNNRSDEYHSYLLRLWRGSPYGGWCASLHCTRTGEWLNFSDIASLLAFIKTQTEDQLPGSKSSREA